MTEDYNISFHLATLALLIACGCPDEKLDEAYALLEHHDMPEGFQALAAQVRDVVALIQMEMVDK